MSCASRPGRSVAAASLLCAFALACTGTVRGGAEQASNAAGGTEGRASSGSTDDGGVAGAGSVNNDAGGEGGASGSGGEGGDDPPPPPFEPTPPSAYVAKVKNILTGLAATEEEVARVTSDSSELRALIDTWMATDQFRDKQLAFFRVAFQQGNLTNTSFDLIAHDGYGMGNRLPAYDNAMDSFPRTAWHFVETGQPFNRVITTDSWMVTPALASVIVWFDSRKIDDDNNAFSIDGAQGQRYEVAHDEAIASVGPVESYQMSPVMRWYTPCELTEPRFVDDSFFLDLNRFIWGEILGGPPGCGQPVLFEPEDFTTWRMVRFRQAQGDEPHARFYDFASLRQADELVVEAPKVGFFTTPAFFANWPTNDSNQGRVITNQTLIVALGGAFNPSDVTVPLITTTLSPEHAEPGSLCYGCHKSLDPMRVFFRKTFSLYYGHQLDPEWTELEPSFAWRGVQASGETIYDLAQLLATHPSFAAAWTQKLCFYAISKGCDEKDPEFERVAQAFQDSDLDYKTLVRELFSSPLVTGAERTLTHTEEPMPVSITRSNHYCALLEARLGLDDPCGLGLSIRVQHESLSYQIATNIPGDTYSRGNVNTVPPTEPSLFTRAAAEALCANVARKAVDPEPPNDPQLPLPANRYPSADAEAAMTDMVSTLMALPASDPRSAPALAMLRKHFEEASAIDGISATDALRSVFTLACSSPTVAGVGL